MAKQMADQMAMLLVIWRYFPAPAPTLRQARPKAEADESAEPCDVTLCSLFLSIFPSFSFLSFLPFPSYFYFELSAIDILCYADRSLWVLFAPLLAFLHSTKSPLLHVLFTY